MVQHKMGIPDSKDKACFVRVASSFEGPRRSYVLALEGKIVLRRHALSYSVARVRCMYCQTRVLRIAGRESPAGRNGDRNGSYF